MCHGLFFMTSAEVRPALPCCYKHRPAERNKGARGRRGTERLLAHMGSRLCLCGSPRRDKVDAVGARGGTRRGARREARLPLLPDGSALCRFRLDPPGSNILHPCRRGTGMALAGQARRRRLMQGSHVRQSGAEKQGLLARASNATQPRFRADWDERHAKNPIFAGSCRRMPLSGCSRSGK